MDSVEVERRNCRRYDLRFPVHYRVSEKGAATRTGSGSTYNLSSSGVGFRCRRALPVGAHIEMTVDWPSKYGDLYPVELLITGFIVRSDGGRIAVRVSSRRFRVDSVPAQPFRATA